MASSARTTNQHNCTQQSRNPKLIRAHSRMGKGTRIQRITHINIASVVFDYDLNNKLAETLIRPEWLLPVCMHSYHFLYWVFPHHYFDRVSDSWLLLECERQLVSRSVYIAGARLLLEKGLSYNFSKAQGVFSFIISFCGVWECDNLFLINILTVYQYSL